MVPPRPQLMMVVSMIMVLVSNQWVKFLSGAALIFGQFYCSFYLFLFRLRREFRNFDSLGPFNLDHVFDISATAGRTSCATTKRNWHLEHSVTPNLNIKMLLMNRVQFLFKIETNSLLLKHCTDPDTFKCLMTPDWARIMTNGSDQNKWKKEFGFKD